MEEFKFWAIPYSFKQLFMIAISICVVFFAVIFIIDVEKYFFHMWIGALLWVFIAFVLTVRSVKISLSEEGYIRICMNGRQKYEGDIERLEYVRGTNINTIRGRAALTMKFTDRKFRFSILELKGFPMLRDSQQALLLKYVVSEFNFIPELSQDSFFNRIYTYRNPGYKGNITE